MIELKREITPSELEEILLRLISEYGAKIEELQKAVIEEANAKIKFDIEYSKEYLKAKTQKKDDGKGITDKEAEAFAIIATSKLELEYEIAKAHRRAIEEVLKNISTEIDIIRSIYSFRKAELERTMR